MTDKKSWGSTVAGWFIERDENARDTDAPAADMNLEDAEAIIRGASGGTQAAPAAAYTTPSPTQTVFQTAPPPPTGGQVDFESVFDAAGVDADERARVAKTIELLKSLPAGTDAG